MSYELLLKTYDLDQNGKGIWESILAYSTIQLYDLEPKIYFFQGLLYFAHDSFYNITDLPGKLLPPKILRDGKVQLLDSVIPYVVYE